MGRGSLSKAPKVIKARRKAGVRTPSGQLSRAIAYAQPKEDPTEVVVDARMRHHGLKDGQARSQLAGTAYGRLFMHGKIGSAGMQACERYLVLRHQWLRIVGAPREALPANLTADPIRTTGVRETPEEVEQRVRMAWERLQAAFQYRGALLSALNDVVVRNEDISVSRFNNLKEAIKIVAILEGIEDG